MKKTITIPAEIFESMYLNKKKEGGNVYDPNVLNLAKQYNLSPDRVIELMQEGGQTQEQQPDQMEQVTQMIAQALQQGTPPEQVAQQLENQIYESVKNLSESEAMEELRKIGMVK